MRISTVVAVSVLSLFCASQAGAQARPNPDPGVTPVRQIDRAEVRVTRVELQPGAIRSVHQHDDVRFHLFIPVEGKLELTIGSAKPVEATPGQAFFMERGTPHGFRNVGSTPAAVMEVFVKDGGANAQRSPGQAMSAEEAQALAQTMEAFLAHPANRVRQATTQP